MKVDPLETVGLLVMLTVRSARSIRRFPRSFLPVNFFRALRFRPLQVSSSRYDYLRKAPILYVRIFNHGCLCIGEPKIVDYDHRP
jgi:hypothetical protein